MIDTAFPDLITANVEALRAQVGERYADASFAGYRIYHKRPEQAARQQAAVAAIRGYLVDLPDRFRDCGGLVVRGTVGTGKDYLTAAAALEAAARGYVVAWREGEELFGEVRRFEGATPTEGVAKRLIRADILCLSDPVPVSGTLEPRQAEWLKAVVHGRYKRMRPTWVTLNALDEAACEAMLTPPVWDRVRHAATVVTCQWDTFRGFARAHAPRIERPSAPARPRVRASDGGVRKVTPEELERARRKGFAFSPKSPPVAADQTEAEADAVRRAQIARLREALEKRKDAG